MSCKANVKGCGPRLYSPHISLFQCHCTNERQHNTLVGDIFNTHFNVPSFCSPPSPFCPAELTSRRETGELKRQQQKTNCYPSPAGWMQDGGSISQSRRDAMEANEQRRFCREVYPKRFAVGRKIVCVFPSNCECLLVEILFRESFRCMFGEITDLWYVMTDDEIN